MVDKDESMELAIKAIYGENVTITRGGTHSFTNEEGMRQFWNMDDKTNTHYCPNCGFETEHRACAPYCRNCGYKAPCGDPYS